MGGTHIAPAEGCDIIKYDPLEIADEGTPYNELLNVWGDTEALCRWAERFGLLGILLHQTLEAFFWPRWDVVNPDSPFMSRPEIQQVQYRVGHGAELQVFQQSSLVVHGGGEPGAPVTPDELELAVQAHDFWMGVRPPGVRYMEPSWGLFGETDIAEGYAQFFPRVRGVSDYAAQVWRDKYAWLGKPPTTAEVDLKRLGDELNRLVYPEPLSDTFLCSYGEPISLMRAYIYALYETVRFWNAAAEARSVQELDSLTMQDWRVEARFPPPFTAALAGVQPSAVPWDNDGEGVSWGLGWNSRSLYGSLNSMVLRDFAFRGMRRLECPRCHQPFVTKQYNKKYCSPQCQGASEIARYRERCRDQRREIQQNLEGST